MEKLVREVEKLVLLCKLPVPLCLITHAQINVNSRAATYAPDRNPVCMRVSKMSDLKVYNHVSENAKQDNLEQDLAEKLTQETPRTSSDGEYSYKVYLHYS